MADRCDVAVVGGGPVGLLLGCRLAQRGVDVRVLERDRCRRSESRAIGVHPPGLACLLALGVADALIACGVRVKRGLAFAEGRALGAISFANLPEPFSFVLSVPQSHTETLLEAQLETYAPGALRRGAEVIAIELEPERVTLCLASAGQRTLEAAFVVGCDGKQSTARTAAHIEYEGGRYRDRFLMGDFADETGFGLDAAVFLTDRGLVESFPLPGQRRRWVVGTGTRRSAPDAELLCTLIAERTGRTVQPTTSTLVSAFAAEHFFASRFASGRLALAGDAAHVVSPIGGQGMNLGWLDAWALADRLCACLREAGRLSGWFGNYDRVRQHAARRASRRAELFMAIGRRSRWPRVRDAFVQLLLSPLLAPRAARLFTMGGL